MILSFFCSNSLRNCGSSCALGWSGGAMVLGKLPVPGRPTNLDYSRARAYCPCSRCGWGLFGHFYSHLSFSPLSPSLWETARYRLKYCLKGPLNPKQPTNQILRFLHQKQQEHGRILWLGVRCSGNSTPTPPFLLFFWQGETIYMSKLF